MTALLFSSIGTTLLLVYMDYFDSHTSEEMRKTLTLVDDEELGTLVPADETPVITSAEARGNAGGGTSASSDGAVSKQKNGGLQHFDGFEGVAVKGSPVPPVRSPFSQVSSREDQDRGLIAVCVMWKTDRLLPGGMSELVRLS